MKILLFPVLFLSVIILAADEKNGGIPPLRDIRGFDEYRDLIITKGDEPQVKAIEQRCQAYLDCYMKNVIEMADIVEYADGSYEEIERDDDDSYEDLNSEDKKDESVGVVLSLLKDYIDLKRDGPQVKAIEQRCQAYLDCYMSNVIEMADIVEYADGSREVIERDDDDSYEDLNSEEKKDESVEVVLSLLKNYIDLKMKLQ